MYSYCLKQYIFIEIVSRWSKSDILEDVSMSKIACIVTQMEYWHNDMMLTWLLFARPAYFIRLLITHGIQRCIAAWSDKTVRRAGRKISWKRLLC